MKGLRHRTATRAPDQGPAKGDPMSSQSNHLGACFWLIVGDKSLSRQPRLLVASER